jgi:hypothetical protein
MNASTESADLQLAAVPRALLRDPSASSCAPAAITDHEPIDPGNRWLIGDVGPKAMSTSRLRKPAMRGRREAKQQQQQQGKSV